MDIPRLVALNKVWATVPPLPSQLVRVLAYLGLAPEAKPVSAPAAGLSEEEAALLATASQRSSQKIMSPEEYLGGMNG